MTENIQHLKLVNGDELIGDVVGETDLYFCVDYPMSLDNWMDPTTGSTGIILNRFCPFSDDNYVEIKREDVTLNYRVHDIMKDYYYVSVKSSDKAASRLFEQLMSATDVMQQMLNASVVSDSAKTDSHIPFIHKGTSTVN